MDETRRQLAFFLSQEFNTPTLSAWKRGILVASALLIAFGIGLADYTIGQGTTFFPLYVIIIATLSFYEGFLAGVAAAWLVCLISLGVDLFVQNPLPRQMLYLRIGLQLAMFIVVAAAASWIGRIYIKLKDLSTRDGLTGLFNHAHFKTHLAEELARVTRFDRPLSIIMLDLDHFKSINDTFGHSVGDKLLKELGDLLRTNLRAVDVPARYGGEEFAILLPETGSGLAIEVAERLRRVVEGHRFLSDHPKGPITITLSGGAAAFDRARSTPDLLLDAADRALYKAKGQGRNCVCG